MMERDTNRTLGKVRNIVEDDTPKAMAPSFHTHPIGKTGELVYIPGTAQRNCDLDGISKKNYSHFLI
jgi:hypothetical protein